MSTRAWAFSIPWLLSSETPILTGASGRSRRNLRAPRLHGRPQRGELAHATGRALEDRVDPCPLVRRQIESVPASLASTSAGVRAPTSAVLMAGFPSTHASAI